LKIETFDLRLNRTVCAGDYNAGTGTFVKRVGPRHFMRMMGGYGIQEEVVRRLAAEGCKRVVIKVRGGATYHSGLAAWLAPDIKVRDFGHGPQRFLPVARMSAAGAVVDIAARHAANLERREAAGVPPPVDLPQQKTLF